MVVSAAGSTDARIKVSSDERGWRWFEVGLVLVVAFGRPILNSLYLLGNRPAVMPQISNARWILSGVEEVIGLLLLGYVLSRRGLKFRNLGLRWSMQDVGVGMAVSGFAFAAYIVGCMVVRSVYYAVYGGWPHGPTARDFFGHPAVAFVPFSLLNPFFEELIVRAYLMTEIAELTGSAVLAVAVSVAVQTCYHLYYGWAGAISLSFLFLTFALYYARSQRALPIIVAHGFFDLYALLRLW